MSYSSEGGYAGQDRFGSGYEVDAGRAFPKMV